MAAAPPPSTPETRDWTFGLEAGCPECGYELHDPAMTGERLRATVPRWAAVLKRADAASRPSERVWSALEYACHSRDLIQILGERVHAMLTETDPPFTVSDLCRYLLHDVEHHLHDVAG